jgi:signal peptide peptidase SppA
MFTCPIKKLKKLCGHKEKPTVACINLNGVIGKDSKLSSGINFENTAPLLEKAFKIKNVKAVAININSPGGSPVQSELIYDYIRELSTEKKIPVYTFAQDVAASGGYFLLIAGDEIYAHNSSIIGSIGVIFSSFGFVDLLKKLGVSRRVYTEGKNKAILDPFLPEEKENIAILKDAQHDIFENFRDLVKSRRQDKLKGDDDYLNNNVFTGAFWSGKKSFELGLVDGVSDLRSKMKEKFGKDVKIVKINIKKSLLKSFFSEKFLGVFFDKIEEKAKFGQFGL